ncbi:hypothetical protein LCGC14_0510320 [marine sediment metagenome]|uniref:HNH domain-containing protein n=1 Tax=marine sediment metagenome TaxID=412755 RepID=A0A0F9UN40_9ZZZZ
MRPFPDPSILLHPQIPKPLHLLNPRTILGDVWWNNARREAYWRHGYYCHACSVHGTEAAHQKGLEAHEMYDIDYITGRVEFIEVVALCHFCHNYIHQGRLDMILRKGEITAVFYLAVLRHGERILEKAGLPLDLDAQLIDLLRDAGKMCDWGDYHLVIDGKSYGRRFESMEEWERHWEQGGLTK